MKRDTYISPLESRYASLAMRELFGDQKKFSTWRRIWLALAEAQQELGLKITAGQIRQMRQHLDDIDFEKAAQYEKKLRHDVMAHIHAFGEAAPLGRFAEGRRTLGVSFFPDERLPRGSG